jgi:hypothetical protein
MKAWIFNNDDDKLKTMASKLAHLEKDLLDCPIQSSV